MLINEANRLKVKWETTVNPVRPYYSGTETVMALGQEDGYDREKIKKAIAKKLAFLPSEIVILEIEEVEKGGNSSQGFNLGYPCLKHYETPY
jgi:hypothetical protein